MIRMFAVVAMALFALTLRADKVKVIFPVFSDITRSTWLQSRLHAPSSMSSPWIK